MWFWKRPIGKRLISPYHDDEVIVVTIYLTDKLWRYRFEKRQGRDARKGEHWSQFPYSYYVDNGYVCKQQIKEDSVRRPWREYLDLDNED